MVVKQKCKSGEVNFNAWHELVQLVCVNYYVFFLCQTCGKNTHA